MKLAICSVAVAALALSGCATNYQADSRIYDASHLEGATKVSFLVEDGYALSLPGYPDFPADAASHEVRAAIVSKFPELGFRHTGCGESPDLFIGFAMGASEMSDAYVGAYAGRFQHHAQAMIVEHNYVEGTLVIELFDPESGERVWSGWASHDFRTEPSDKRRKQIIEGAVDAILDQLDE